MIHFFSKHKLIFYSSNVLLIAEYFFHGSLIGCIIYGDCKIQPQLNPNFIVSINHFFGFFLLSFVGFLTFRNLKKLKFLKIYLISLAILLEVFHLFISYRNFEFSDLFGNLGGVLIMIIINNLVLKYENSKK